MFNGIIATNCWEGYSTCEIFLSSVTISALSSIIEEFTRANVAGKRTLMIDYLHRTERAKERGGNVFFQELE